MLGGLTKEQLRDPKIAESLKGPQGERGLPGDANVLPHRAVVAFDLKSCPDGWDDYHEGAGRFIVGAGRHTEHDEYGHQVKALVVGEEGGNRTHKLIGNELAPHAHSLVWGQGRGRPGKITGSDIYRDAELNIFDLKQKTGVEGQGTPHNNMPPYKVLLLCKKE